MAVAMLERGYDVHWCVLGELDLDNPNYLKELKVRKILRFENKDGVDVPQFAAYQTAAASDYDVILHRKDPPIDEFYIWHCNIILFFFLQ